MPTNTGNPYEIAAYQQAMQQLQNQQYAPGIPILTSGASSIPNSTPWIISGGSSILSSSTSSSSNSASPETFDYDTYPEPTPKKKLSKMDQAIEDAVKELRG